MKKDKINYKIIINLINTLTPLIVYIIFSVYIVFIIIDLCISAGDKGIQKYMILINTLICVSIFILSGFGLFQFSNSNIPFFIFNVIILIILMLYSYQYSMRDRREVQRRRLATQQR